MKKYFILLCSLAAVAVSCQKNDEATSASVQKSTEGKIVFAASASTKADFAEVTTDNLKKFRVSSYYNGSDSLFFSNLDVTYDGGVFKTGYYSPEKGATLDFYAIYPLCDSIRFDKAAKKSYFGYKQNDESDLVVSWKSVDCPIKEPVQLTFGHALAQLRIKARGVCKDSSLTVVLDTVLVMDVPDSGLFKLDADSTWTTEGFAKDSVLFIKDTVKMKSDTTAYTWIGGENFAKTFIPDGKLLKLRVVYHLENGSVPVGEVRAKTAPFKAPLKLGKRNFLSINLKPGTVDDIQFTLEVSPWGNYELPSMDF